MGPHSVCLENSQRIPLALLYLRSAKEFRFPFLGATKHLYNWLCPLVGWSVGRVRIRSTIHMSHLIGLLGLVYEAFGKLVLFWCFLGCVKK